VLPARESPYKGVAGFSQAAGRSARLRPLARALTRVWADWSTEARKAENATARALRALNGKWLFLLGFGRGIRSQPACSAKGRIR